MKKALVAACLVTSFAASSQTAVDSVIIQEARLQIPYSSTSSDIQILSRKDIEALPVKSIAEILAYAASTDIRQRGPWGTQADISIDGSNFDAVLVLVNGIKFTDPQTGHHKLNLPVPLAAIERIEILRGPASRIYGIDALAGAINIVTRMPAQNALLVETQGGSSLERDTSSGKLYAGWSTEVTGALSGSKTSHLFSIGRMQGNGYRYNTDYDNYRLYYGNTLQLTSRNSLQTMGAYVRNTFGASLFYAPPGDKEATETVQTAIAGLKWTHQANSRLRITPLISYRYNKDDYIYIRQKPEVYHNIHETHVASAEINASYDLGKGRAGLGVEWRHQRINSNSLGRHERDNLGAYAGYAYPFSSRLKANAGVYLNHNADFGTQLLPGIEAGYELSRNWKLSASAGSGERQPTYTDLYYKGPTNIGNDALQPERALYAEIISRYQVEYGNVEISLGYRRISDFIDWVRLSESEPWQPQNYAQMNTSLLSVRGSYDAGKRLRFPTGYALRLMASYTYLEPSVENPELLSTKYTLDALHHKGVLRVTSVLGGKVEINLDARYQQRFNAADYWLADSRVVYHAAKAFRIYGDVNNILNTAYYESGGTPLPGRWFTLGFRYEFS